MKRSIEILAFVFLLVLTACTGRQSNRQVIPVTTVRQGTFYIDLYEEGEIQATQSKIISSPEISWRYGSNLKIATLIEDGTEVEAGDTVMTFDPTEVRKAIVDAEQRLEIHYAELEKMKTQQKSNLEGMLSDLEVSRISLEISRLNLESSQFEAEITRKEIELNLEQAEISLQQSEAQIENTKRQQREEMQQMKLTIQQAESELKDANETLNLLAVTAPSPGIVIIRRNFSTQAKYQEGEQVWGGQQMIELPNLRELKVELKVNEVDIAKVSKGLKVIVRPDAFSDSTYQGEIMKVANLAVNKTRDSKIKVFPVEVLITSPVNQHTNGTPELMPGLTVSCRIIIDEIPNSVFIPLNCLFQQDNEDVVFVKTAGGFKQVAVKTGQRNTDYVIIESGLKGGEEIAMTNPLILEKSKTDKE